MPQALHELNLEEVTAIENRIEELQEHRNGFVPSCPQCFMNSVIRWIMHDSRISYDRDDCMPLPRMRVRYATLSSPHPDENPPLNRIDVTWKCGNCQIHANGSIRLDGEHELEELREMFKGDRYDAAKAPEDPDLREEQMRALGYLE